MATKEETAKEFYKDRTKFIMRVQTEDSEDITFDEDLVINMLVDFAGQETKALKDKLDKTTEAYNSAYEAVGYYQQQLTEANALIEEMGEALQKARFSVGMHISGRTEVHDNCILPTIKAYNEYKTKQTTTTTQEVTKP